MQAQRKKNIEKIIEKLGIETKDYWVNMFSSLPAHEVGVIKASGKLLSEPMLPLLCEEISYLGNETGFYLPLVVGGGAQYDKLSGEKINGIRITDKKLINAISEIAVQNQEKVSEKLKEAGINATIIPFNSICAVPHGYETDKNNIKHDVGFVGDIFSIDTKPIITAIHNKTIPVITHIGANNGNNYNINATTVAKELVKYLQAKKLIIIGNTPVYDKTGNLIKNIYSDLEFKKLCQTGIIQGGMITNCKEAYGLLNYLGPGHSIQITSLDVNKSGEIKSTGLLEELLGKGSGTMIMTPPIITQYPLGVIDKNLLISMIDGAFGKGGKKLIDGYFESIASKNPTIYLDALKKGGAISYPLGDMEYMCKCFTDKEYEGLGISNSIISTILQHKKVLVWRTSIDNTQKYICNYKKIVAHYNGFSEEIGKYIIFGIGIDNSSKPKVINMISKIPASFEAIR